MKSIPRLEFIDITRFIPPEFITEDGLRRLNATYEQQLLEIKSMITSNGTSTLDSA